jgi:hypothetical protein
MSAKWNPKRTDPNAVALEYQGRVVDLFSFCSHDGLVPPGIGPRAV